VCPVVSSDDRQRYGVGLGEVEAGRARPGAHFVPPAWRAAGATSSGLACERLASRMASMTISLARGVRLMASSSRTSSARLATVWLRSGSLSRMTASVTSLHADRADRIVEQRPLRPDSPLRRAETRAAIGVRSGHTAILASGAFCIWPARRRACPGPRGHGCGTASLYQYCGTVVLY
jgi:hypothetical protein